MENEMELLYVYIYIYKGVYRDIHKGTMNTTLTPIMVVQVL